VRALSADAFGGPIGTCLRECPYPVALGRQHRSAMMRRSTHPCPGVTHAGDAEIALAATSPRGVWGRGTGRRGRIVHFPTRGEHLARVTDARREARAVSTSRPHWQALIGCSLASRAPCKSPRLREGAVAESAQQTRPRTPGGASRRPRSRPSRGPRSRAATRSDVAARPRPAQPLEVPEQLVSHDEVADDLRGHLRIQSRPASWRDLVLVHLVVILPCWNWAPTIAVGGMSFESSRVAPASWSRLRIHGQRRCRSASRRSAAASDSKP